MAVLNELSTATGYTDENAAIWDANIGSHFSAWAAEPQFAPNPLTFIRECRWKKPDPKGVEEESEFDRKARAYREAARKRGGGEE